MTEQKEKMEHCYCPYCDEELMDVESPWYRKPLSQNNQSCPHCGAEIKGVG